VGAGRGTGAPGSVWGAATAVNRVASAPQVPAATSITGQGFVAVRLDTIRWKGLGQAFLAHFTGCPQDLDYILWRPHR